MNYLPSFTLNMEATDLSETLYISTRLHGIISQTTVIFIATVVSTSTMTSFSKTLLVFGAYMMVQTVRL